MAQIMEVKIFNARARLMIHVRHGKGAKDRYVPLPQRTLQ